MVAACASLKSLEQSFEQSVFRQEKATVLVSVNTVVLWDQIANAVQPNFSLTGDQALLQIAPTTEHIQEQILRAFGVNLGLGISPANTVSKISTPQPPTGVPAGGQLPTAPSVSGDIGLDPILKYQAASALYQAVQLLNREIQYATVGGEFIPYLVTMKFAVIPYTHKNLPYDIHARISFFPSSDTSANLPPDKDTYKTIVKLPRVVPILVTDDIERALKSSAVEAVRQIGLALSGSFQGVGGSLAASNVNQALNAISGQDINSRLTVTRLLDNTIYAKIGASYEPTAGVALVGQTYNISLLILVPSDYFAGQNWKPQIQIFVNSEFRDALKGNILAKRPTNMLVNQTDEAMQAVLGTKLDYEKALETWKNTTGKQKEYFARELISSIEISAFDVFETNLKGMPFLDILTPDDMMALWTRLSVILVDSSLKGANFELPLPLPISIPAQSPLLIDDTKDKAQVQLQTTSGASSHTLTAALKLNQSGSSNQYELVAQTISLDESTGVLTLTFPSPAKLGIKESDLDKSSLVIGNRCLTPSLQENDPRCPKLVVPDPPIYTLRYCTVKVVDAVPGLDFTAVTTEIGVTKGVGSAEVSVAKLNDDYALITVQGVQVDKATDGSGAPLTITNGQVKVIKDTKDTKDTKVVSIIFQLRGLFAGKTFTIQAEGYKGSSTTGKKQISFTAIGR
jgi:hypothetical protein